MVCTVLSCPAGKRGHIIRALICDKSSRPVSHEYWLARTLSTTLGSSTQRRRFAKAAQLTYEPIPRRTNPSETKKGGVSTKSPREPSPPSLAPPLPRRAWSNRELAACLTRHIESFKLQGLLYYFFKPTRTSLEPSHPSSQPSDLGLPRFVPPRPLLPSSCTSSPSSSFNITRNPSKISIGIPQLLETARQQRTRYQLDGTTSPERC